MGSPSGRSAKVPLSPDRNRTTVKIVMSTLAPPLTVEDYRILDETGPRYQLIEGALHMAPAPNRYHQHISRNIEFTILKWIEEGGGGEIYDAPFDVYLDNTNVFQPDLIYVSPDRLSILTDAGAEGAPDLVVEILSPKTRKLDLGPKKSVFARHGVKELWIVDPDLREIDRFDLTTNATTPIQHLTATDRFTSPTLPGLTIECAAVFHW